ncbi:molybdenum cofactor biosynthesis protein MoaE [Thiothrix nivea]|uniref:Molybdopterin synthase catalytic subunit n=1 Tax=Thiothrix nivea (strain ATCC 35100 / DSM 5205 / JP2) TaxID=870187 RepID=A0A656HE06_THINJ|nr:molybdenum cofactor biosynthesis protein MoaE [Thiothrix nivea]EIJ34593.1 molybdopterin biosynthesis MoaE protein [Thiothrix nivea DSM 5205]
MHIELLTDRFDPWRYLADWQAQQQQDDSVRSGATAVFVGTMRDFNEGDAVREMYLEYYPGMTERQLVQLAGNAQQEWSLDNVLIVHRVGKITPSQAIVLVAVWSAHRAEAFEACRHMMEVLKHTAPFWKRETLADGSERWVEKNTPG